MAIKVGTSGTTIKKAVVTGSVTTVKKIVVGTPVKRVTSGANTIFSLGGVDTTGLTDGAMLVYNDGTEKFESTVDLSNENTNFNGGNF